MDRKHLVSDLLALARTLAKCNRALAESHTCTAFGEAELRFAKSGCGSKLRVTSSQEFGRPIPLAFIAGDHVSSVPNILALPGPRPVPSMQRRFWDETVRLLGLFEKHRELHDNANAMACFGVLAHHRFYEVSRLPTYDPTKTSIISIFQAKSGGTYLHNRMLQLGYHDFWWMFPHTFCHSICYASDEALRYYMHGGCTCHSHARPDPNILAALDRAGIQRIWVHLRNPAETVVSAYHHNRGEGQGEGVIGEQRTQQAMVEAQRQGLAPGMTKSAFVMHKIGWHVDWVAEWLRFAKDRPGLVVFSYYHELANPQAMFARVFDELGVRFRATVSASPMGHDRYRKKTSTNWRHDLTIEAQDYLESRTRVDLEGYPHFYQLWS